jgi:spore coat protein U-like protein
MMSVTSFVGRCTFKIAAAALLLLPFAGALHAATATSTFSVQMTVTSSCVINSTATLNFGSQGVLVANVNGTSALAVQCTNTTPYNIGLDQGQGSGATVAARKMSSGANTITYTLYSDTNRTVLWGNTVGTNTMAGIGNGASQSYTIYGQVPPQNTPTPAVYTDTVTVTVTY